MNIDGDGGYTSPLTEAAISMHEMYITLRSVGFSRRDALELVAKMLINGVIEDSEDEYESDDNDDGSW